MGPSAGAGGRPSVRGSSQRLGFALVPPEPVDQGSRASPAGPRRRRAPPALDQIVRILARGQGDEGQRAAGADMGERPQRRAHAGLLPGIVAVEAHERGRGELPEQGRADASVSAVPSGARVSRKPAPSSATTSICPSTTMTRRSGRPGGPGLMQVEQGPALVEQRVCPGSSDIWASPSPRIRPEKAMHRPARIPDRKHEPAAEAVIGLLVVFRFDEKPGLYQLVISESSSAHPGVSPDCPAPARTRTSSGSPPRPRAAADSHAPRHLRQHPAAPMNHSAAASITS